jgi:hypothetical protein
MSAPAHPRPEADRTLLPLSMLMRPKADALVFRLPNEFVDSQDKASVAIRAAIFQSDTDTVFVVRGKKEFHGADGNAREL